MAQNKEIYGVYNNNRLALEQVAFDNSEDTKKFIDKYCSGTNGFYIVTASELKNSPGAFTKSLGEKLIRNFNNPEWVKRRNSIN